MFYTDRFSADLTVGPMAKHKDKIKVYELSNFSSTSRKNLPEKKNVEGEKLFFLAKRTEENATFQGKKIVFSLPY